MTLIENSYNSQLKLNLYQLSNYNFIVSSFGYLRKELILLISRQTSPLNAKLAKTVCINTDNFTNISHCIACTIL